jgi:dephospho-CoA kinase
MESARKPLRVGLTGGIASGKSTVADMFAELGVPVIDTDVIAREVVEPGQPALEEIRDSFGKEVIAVDGNLDRAAMRRRVFADDNARRRLEAILHPRIRESAMQQADLAGGAYQLIVVPLLAESPMRQAMDRILVVDCDVDVQVARLLERDAETEDQARRIIGAQASREQRLAIADEVIRNDGPISETRRQVEQLHSHYLRLSANSDI